MLEFGVGRVHVMSSVNSVKQHIVGMGRRWGRGLLCELDISVMARGCLPVFGVNNTLGVRASVNTEGDEPAK